MKLLGQESQGEGAPLAFRLGTLCQSLTWHEILSSLPESATQEYAFMLPRCLREFLTAMLPDGIN